MYVDGDSGSLIRKLQNSTQENTNGDVLIDDISETSN